MRYTKNNHRHHFHKKKEKCTLFYAKSERPKHFSISIFFFGYPLKNKTHTQTHTRTHKHTHTNTHINTHTHTHTHTQTHTQTTHI